MTDVQLQEAARVEQQGQMKPLVLEIIPGHAAEGLIEIYEPGSYEDEPLRDLIERALRRRNLSIEEQLILEDIYRQLEGGKLLCRGEDLGGAALELAASEQTEAGEEYYYLPVHAIRPQEGGLFRQKLWN